MSRRGHILQPRWGQGRTRGSVGYRFEAARRYVEGKDVLDLGGAAGHGRVDWIHGSIAEVARSTVGVDLDKSRVQSAARDGYSMVVGDVLTTRLDQDFDVVFAGELIEHLVNVGALFETARHHLRPGGVFLLTTPNPFAVSNFIYRVGGKAHVNQDHTGWFCEDTIRTVARKCGFEVVDIRYLAHRSPLRWRALVGRMVRAPLPGRLAWNTLFAAARPV